MMQIEQVNDVAIVYTANSVDITFARPAEPDIEAELQAVSENPGISVLASYEKNPFVTAGDLYKPSQGRTWSFWLGAFYEGRQVAFEIANCLRDAHGLRVALTCGDNPEDGDFVYAIRS